MGVYKIGTEPEFSSNYEVIKNISLNFTDILFNNNKCYVCELQKDDKDRVRICSFYGRVSGTMNQEYRIYNTLFEAEKEFDKLIKSKLKKGYVEVALAKVSVGSDKAKEKIEVSKVSVEDAKKLGIDVKEEDKSKLHLEVQSLVKTWFGITNDFIELKINTKDCPLGQLSLEQISKGRNLLDESRKLIHSGKDVKSELDRLTNSYYSNIPHNFGYTRINADVLRLDSDFKIDQANDILDVLSDAKNAQTVFTKKSSVDSQYASLNAELEYMDPSDKTWKWIDTMFHETRAHNHSGLGKIKIHRIFKLKRNNEEKYWLETAEKIAKEKCDFNPSKTYDKLVNKRPDISEELESLYQKANILPGWHGTRSANMIGITTKGYLIRPSGVVHSGSMYGDAIYVSSCSTKSINYCDVRGSYWAQGSGQYGYLFLNDCIFGRQKMANGSFMYTKDNIKPYHSVWAQAGKSGVINDEMMLYYPSGPNQQHYIRYIIEFETQIR